MFGLTSSGFIKKTLADSKTELEAVFRAAFGAGIKVTPDTQFGKFIGVLADRESQIWEMAEAVYNSQYPNSAGDTSLDHVAEITAISRNPATRTTVTAYMAGTNGTLITTGTLFATVDANDQFRTLADVNLSGTQFSITSLQRSGTTVTAQATAHGKIVGQYLFISGANEAGYNGLIRIATVPDPNSFTYEITATPTTPATGAISADPATVVNCEAVLTGPIPALSGTLTQIVNTTPGLNTVSNELDGILGRNLETDDEFRTRRLAALSGLGAARLEAIRGALLQVTGVTAATVFENDDDVTDGLGRPPHSIEALVQGGQDADILFTVWNKKAGGIKTFGTISGIVTDSQGNDHTSRFSRPTGVNIWIEMDLTVTTDFPGTPVVEAAILDHGNTLSIGDDVIVFPALVGALNQIPGIIDVVIRIGTAASPTLDNNIVITETSLAIFDSSRILLVTV